MILIRVAQIGYRRSPLSLALANQRCTWITGFGFVQENKLDESTGWSDITAIDWGAPSYQHWILLGPYPGRKTMCPRSLTNLRHLSVTKMLFAGLAGLLSDTFLVTALTAPEANSPSGRSVVRTPPLHLDFLSRLGQPDSISVLVIPSDGMAVEHRKGVTAERLFCDDRPHHGPILTLSPTLPNRLGVSFSERQVDG
ncbi:hypothetical protein CSKR_112952 [Clonorchis sinensis]|uniref:Uncharacterized protein n=1 Tax=Clonorchis sinensis TaxID=79923 RepID=A0A419PTB7_CLOSI|nr:hypothetical protein CSKR_112952 [Clonorchis sinensis]